jgi:hypothetical protein
MLVKLYLKLNKWIFMYKILFSLLLTGLLNAAVYDGVAIVVKDKVITLLDIKNKMQETHSSAKIASNLLVRQKLEEIERHERKITVTNSEVFDEIRKTAQRNKLNISEFYEAVRNANGLSSTELKAKIKQKLLTQKLYLAIAYTAVEEPSEKDIQEYYDLHKEDFKHPSEFTVIIYQAKDKNRIEEKVNNPMFYSPDIQQNEQVLPYNKISPELAKLLTNTKLNHCSTIVPDGKKGYMSFYIKAMKSAKEAGVESMKDQIINAIMTEQRESVLGNYFARLRQNTTIKTLRLPK